MVEYTFVAASVVLPKAKKCNRFEINASRHHRTSGRCAAAGQFRDRPDQRYLELCMLCVHITPLEVATPRSTPTPSTI